MMEERNYKHIDVYKRQGKTPDLIIMASGSEVHVALEAAMELQEKNIDVRVVSMPCWELFEDQEDAYKEMVLPSHVEKRLAVEAGQSLGWEKYTGKNGAIIGMETFGSSAPGDVVLEKFGFNVDNIVAKALELLG